jgi:hypothetical protein
MSEMIEAVARAIGRVHQYGGSYIAPDGSQHDEVPWKLYIEHARAAIEAMRVPTVAMSKAGQGDISGWDADADVIWHAMIDEALK